MISKKYPIHVSDETLTADILDIMQDDSYEDKDAAYHMLIHRPLSAAYVKSSNGRLVHKESRREYCRGVFVGLKISFNGIK